MVSRQWRQRKYDVDDEDVGSKYDDVHRQTDAHEIAEAVAARTIDQHVGGRADRCGKTAAYANHKGNKEWVWVVAQFLGCFVHDGEEHGACCGVGDELGDEGAD